MQRLLNSDISQLSCDEHHDQGQKLKSIAPDLEIFRETTRVTNTQRANSKAPYGIFYNRQPSVLPLVTRSGRRKADTSANDIDSVYNILRFKQLSLCDSPPIKRSTDTSAESVEPC